MDAGEAHRWGLVGRVVPADQLLAAAHEVATAIAASAPLSIAALLDIERRTLNLSLDDAMSSLKSLASYRRAIDSEDAIEGQAAFTERRPPTWTGH
jgi:crotonobetainyl-CoA hydratase